MPNTQTITAIYDNGVLTPLEQVRLRKRQKVRLKISPLNGQKRKRAASSRRTSRPSKRAQQIKLARESFGMWADRQDITDDWLDEIRAGWERRLNELYQDD
ncbi:MAG: antitoxin family protein [Chloroflexi bacterium]|nr:antitoxin family protein [Chloroflexota bacterium]